MRENFLLRAPRVGHTVAFDALGLATFLKPEDPEARLALLALLGDLEPASPIKPVDRSHTRRGSR